MGWATMLVVVDMMHRSAKDGRMVPPGAITGLRVSLLSAWTMAAGKWFPGTLFCLE